MGKSLFSVLDRIIYKNHESFENSANKMNDKRITNIINFREEPASYFLRINLNSLSPAGNTDYLNSKQTKSLLTNAQMYTHTSFVQIMEKIDFLIFKLYFSGRKILSVG